MRRLNWNQLSRKLITKEDLTNTLDWIQADLGQYALSFWGQGVLLTSTYPEPFPVTMSLGSLGGSVGPGIAYDANGQITRIDPSSSTSKSFTLTAADATRPRWDLLVLQYKQTGNTPVPKPSDPISTVMLNLSDDFNLAVIPGVPGSSPAYAAKGPLDIILCGLKVPAGATTGPQVTVDLGVRENSEITAERIAVDPSQFTRVLDQTDTTLQDCLEDIDSEVNKFFGQLMVVPHPTISTRLVVTGADVLMKDGTTRSQILNNRVVNFPGAQIEFGGSGAGTIYSSDGTTQLGSFAMPSIGTNKYRWFSLAVAAGTVGADNRVSLNLTVNPADTDGSAPSTAPRSSFVSGLPLAEVTLQNTASGLAPLSKSSISLLQLSSNGNGVDVQPNFKFDDLTSAVSGTQSQFNLSSQPYNNQSLVVFLDGVVTTDYSLSGSQITLNRSPGLGQTLSAYYVAQGGSNLMGFYEEPAGAINGANSFYTLAGKPANASSMLVFVNGLALGPSEWSLTQGSSASSVTLTSAPATGSQLIAFYLINVASLGSAPIIAPGGGGAGGVSAKVDNVTLSADNISGKAVTLSATPSNPAAVSLDIVGGTAQIYGSDFTISGNVLTWSGLTLDGTLQAGDVLRILYFV